MPSMRPRLSPRKASGVVVHAPLALAAVFLAACEPGVPTGPTSSASLDVPGAAAPVVVAGPRTPVDGRLKAVGGPAGVAGIRATGATLDVIDLASSTLTPRDLAERLAGPGVVLGGVTYRGAPAAAGTFTGGGATLGIDEGIVLGTGSVLHVRGPNQFEGLGTPNLTAGRLDLTLMAGYPTNDAAALTLRFIPDGDVVWIDYVFASEEYNEAVFTPFNDVFAFLVNGVNCAVIGPDALPVSVNTVNGGNPASPRPAVNPLAYRDNDAPGAAALDTEMDGLTEVLTCRAPVRAGEVNTLTLAIADATDYSYDSNVFIRARSLALPRGGDADGDGLMDDADPCPTVPDDGGRGEEGAGGCAAPAGGGQAGSRGG